MLKVFAFLTKREDIETRAFIDYYEKHHVPLVLSLARPSLGQRPTAILAVGDTRAGAPGDAPMSSAPHSLST